MGFSPILSLLTPAFSLPYSPRVLPISLLRAWNAPLPNMVFPYFRSFGSMLSPGTFSAQNHSTSELLRTLLMMAASEPTSWLFMHLNILLHLAYILGPYLAVWTVFLLTMNFLAHKSDCLPCFWLFGVWLMSVSRGGTIDHSVLYPPKTFCKR